MRYGASPGPMAGAPTLSSERLARLSAAALVGMVALFVAAAVLQVSFLTRVPLPGATPDLVLLVLIGVALARGPHTGAVAGFSAGLMLDLMPPADHAVGRYAFVLCLVGYLLGLIGPQLFGPSYGLVALTALTAAGAFICYVALGAVTGDLRVPWSQAEDLLPTVVLYNAVLALFIVRPVLTKYRPVPVGELGAVISTRKARRLNPLARRQERML